MGTTPPPRSSSSKRRSGISGGPTNEKGRRIDTTDDDGDTGASSYDGESAADSDSEERRDTLLPQDDDDPASNFNYYIVDYDQHDTTGGHKSNVDEKSLFFPPNYHPSYYNKGHGNKLSQSSCNRNSHNNIPSYFLCPITHQIMIDPVIDLEGNTYERHAILRWLVLYQNKSPITGNALTLEELKQDKLVKVAIEKARKDAWVRYIMELENNFADDLKEEMEGHGDEKTMIKKVDKGEIEMDSKISMNYTEGEGGKKDPLPSVVAFQSKSELENYLDRRKSAATHEGSCTSGSKFSGSKNSANSNSQGGRKKSSPPSSSSASKEKQKKEEKQQQKIRPKTPPPSKILLHKDKTVKSIPNSVMALSPPTTPKQLTSPQQQPEGRPIHPMPSITVPSKKTPSTTTNTASTTATTPFSSPTPGMNSNTSVTSAISFSSPGGMHNGWTVPLGVHKIICASPGLLVSTDVHRRSTPVKRMIRDINNNIVKKELIIAPGSYVEILETQVHGGRVRGRIAWEEEDLEQRYINSTRRRNANKKKNKKKKRSLLEKRPKRKSKIFQRGRAKKKEDGEDDSEDDDDDDDSGLEENFMVKYSGWISVQWADEEDEDGNLLDGSGGSGLSDEDAGPWTEPIPLGVYRISFGAGLPLRETTERDSAVLDKLARGRCVEVVETTVKGDRVRARCLVPPLPTQEGDDPGKKPARFQSGWISLLNALTGASGASPVPLGAYVAVAEGGCVITEGGSLDSKEKGTLNPGSCMEVVATRIEEGTVRGLIAAGGHVTLFLLNGAAASTNRLASIGGAKNSDGGRMFAMPVPLGTYQVVQNGLAVTSGLSMNSPVSMKLKVNACAEIAETRVEGGRVRGRLTAVGYGGVAKEVYGWMSLFEPTQRWAKIVCFKGGRPISSPQAQQAQT